MGVVAYGTLGGEHSATHSHTNKQVANMHHQIAYHICRAINSWYNVIAWTGGDSPTEYDKRQPIFRAVQSFIYVDQVEDSGGLGLWAPGTSVLERARLFWNRATLDAWATLRDTPLALPVPNNPLHTHNLATISLLERQDFDGPDRCLRVSLFEYGQAWRTLPSGELLVIYGIDINSKGDHTRFDRSTLNADHDVFEEHNWVDWDSFFDCYGTTREEWSALPLAQKLNDLINHHGYENIMGSSYWEGFTISEE